MLSVVGVTLFIVGYSLAGVFLSGLYIGLDLHETRGNPEIFLASLALVVWPVALLLGLAVLLLLASYRLATRVWQLGRSTGFDLVEILEV